MAIIFDGDFVSSQTGPSIEVGQNYIAQNNFKLYDFDPLTGTLKLDSERFKPGDLEKRLGIEDAVQFVINVPLQIPGYGSRLIQNVRKIVYTDKPMKVDYQPSLGELAYRFFKSVAARR